VDDLLCRCLQGDADARNLFVDRYAPVIHGAVRRLVRGRAPDDASVGHEDVVQEVFLRLFRDGSRVLRTYDPKKASLVTWLTIVARNITLDVLRKKRLSTVTFDPTVHSPATRDTRPPDRELTVPQDLLPTRQRLVLKLLYDEQLEVPEVARILGVQEQTVRSARHKAISSLRAFFQRSDERKNPRSGGDVRSPRTYNKMEERPNEHA